MRKVRFWEVWDWAIIRRLILITVLGIILYFIFFRLPDWIRNSKNDLYTAEIKGKIIKTKEIEQIHMGRTGNYVVKVAIEVEYSYVVNNHTYYAKDKIPNSSEHQRFFNDLTKDPSMNLTIRYNPKNPQQSQVETE